MTNRLTDSTLEGFFYDYALYKFTLTLIDWRSEWASASEFSVVRICLIF